MDAIAPIIVFATLIGGWWLVARRFKASGRGLVVRHLAGATAGTLAMFTAVVILIAIGVIDSTPKDNTVASTDDVKATTVAAVVPTADVANRAAEPAPTPAMKTEYDLDLTPTDFIANLNIALKLTGMTAQLPLKPAIHEGEVNDVYRGSINENLQIVATISKVSGNIKSVTLIAGGDGTIKSGADVMLTGVAVFMAASDRADEEGKSPNADLFMSLLKQVTDTNNDASNVVGIHKYSIMPMEGLGTWIGVEAVS